jgi:hypothetical protein
MSSINTNKYRTFLAQQFQTTLLLSGANASVKANITSTNTSVMSAGAATTSEFYLGVGRPQAWTNDASPPTPTQDTQTLDFTVWRDLLAVKHITANTSALVIARHDWTANTAYAQYDDADTTLMSKSFYVLDTTELPYKVYKCLWNNSDASHPSGANSTVAPSTTGSTVAPGSTADGYVWKYMYTIPADQYTYLTSGWMPVTTNAAIKADAAAYPGKLSTVVPLVVSASGSGYTPSSNVTALIVGDGTGATINGISGSIGVTISANAVANVSLYAGGTGYTTINTVSLTQAGSANTATARALIPPYPNHGYDAVKELGCTSVMLYTQLAYEETHSNSSISVVNDYRRIALLQDPLLADGAVANGIFYQQTHDCVLTSNTATFEPDDVVTVSNTSYAVTGIVVDVIQNANNQNVLRISNVADRGRTAAGYAPFVAGDTLSSSSVTAVLGTIRAPELKLFSGKILYIDQRVPVMRSDAQREDIRLVFGF